METMKILEQLKRDGKITIQAYRTYRGQVLSGNEDGCLRGLKRKGLI